MNNYTSIILITQHLIIRFQNYHRKSVFMQDLKCNIIRLWEINNASVMDRKSNHSPKLIYLFGRMKGVVKHIEFV